MKHHRLTILIATAAVLCVCGVMIASPADAYEGKPVQTIKQEALHITADFLRNIGFTDDSEVIKSLQDAWWEEQEALDIIAKVIQNEADPQWCEWEHSVAVGAVVVNRTKSPYFPNTVREVVSAPGQYLESYTRNFEKTSHLAYEAAKAALDGDHNVPSNAYWQDNKIQGCYIWKSFLLDTGWFRSTTYICCGIPGVG